VVRVLKKLDDDVLDILADIARLGERRGVGDGERHVQDARERLCKQGLARPGRTEQQDVRLLQLHVVCVDLGVDALVMVVDRNGEDLLRALLPDDILIEDVLDLRGLRKWRRSRERLLALDLLRDDVVTQPDALVADVNRRPCDELFYFLL
jgi:hypothetical protein